ncbi:hypothetical protein D3C73_916160 [compost metagenome]
MPAIQTERKRLACQVIPKATAPEKMVLNGCERRREEGMVGRTAQVTCGYPPAQRLTQPGNHMADRIGMFRASGIQVDTGMCIQVDWLGDMSAYGT